MRFLSLTVGEKFDAEIPPEAMSMVLNAGAPMLVFNFAVTEKNIAAFQTGGISFGLFVQNNVLFFLFKITGFLDWSDLAFTVHLSQEKEVNDDGSYLPFHLILVDARTSKINAMRIVTASPVFRSSLSKIIGRQIGEKFDTLGYYKRIGEIYQSYPSASDMLKEAVIIENGGITLPKQA